MAGRAPGASAAPGPGPGSRCAATCRGPGCSRVTRGRSSAAAASRAPERSRAPRTGTCRRRTRRPRRSAPPPRPATPRGRNGGGNPLTRRYARRAAAGPARSRPGEPDPRRLRRHGAAVRIRGPAAETRAPECVPGPAAGRCQRGPLPGPMTCCGPLPGPMTCCGPLPARGPGTRRCRRRCRRPGTRRCRCCPAALGPDRPARDHQAARTAGARQHLAGCASRPDNP